MMRHIKACVALVLLLPVGWIFSASAQDAPETTVSQFLASCTDDDMRSDKAGPADYCVRTLLLEVNMDPEVCMDKMSYGVMAQAIVGWLRNRPDLAGSTASEGLHAAAVALYPCP